jgi:hypothetical protein
MMPCHAEETIFSYQISSKACVLIAYCIVCSYVHSLLSFTVSSRYCWSGDEINWSYLHQRQNWNRYTSSSIVYCKLSYIVALINKSGHHLECKQHEKEDLPRNFLQINNKASFTRLIVWHAYPLHTSYTIVGNHSFDRLFLLQPLPCLQLHTQHMTRTRKVGS